MVKHSIHLLKDLKKPFDMVLMKTMWDTAKYLCENVMGCKIAYTQSDEITLLLTDYDTLTTQAWFDKNIQKMVSVSASMATLAFNKSFVQNLDIFMDEYKETEENTKLANKYLSRINTAMFDSRSFSIPKEEVCNAFIWRQQDATRNSIEMVGRYHFNRISSCVLNNNQIQEMLFQEKGINFNDLPTYQKRGVCIVKEKYNKDGTMRTRWVFDEDIPIFTQDRGYIEKYL